MTVSWRSCQSSGSKFRMMSLSVSRCTIAELLYLFAGRSPIVLLPIVTRTFEVGNNGIESVYQAYQVDQGREAW